MNAKVYARRGNVSYLVPPMEVIAGQIVADARRAKEAEAVRSSCYHRGVKVGMIAGLIAASIIAALTGVI